MLPAVLYLEIAAYLIGPIVFTYGVYAAARALHTPVASYLSVALCVAVAAFGIWLAFGMTGSFDVTETSTRWLLLRYLLGFSLMVAGVRYALKSWRLPP